ncbi:citrate lyase holo-[acyl-carrier protein] synthase [Latilactobacillus sakei]|uniref:citrate lyase holo-[acyl-carrier protein] synthase n=1 Tax=Latilactobacillus sakei TaxID=1599 RepID=A0AAE8J3R5_LATSK|nr:citrate lyase holo-[acyl-carrier protein] synthase [Latilactobacillus sakei]AWZ43976.1 citrate lyase holo-[acyl-carrier protein] synthase [Latilactobacillus sakei]EOR85134.1 apo-citrate lyase phosphoribosyl dephospho-CoA transferase [Latilactobacillus sakei subsp. sakei LS25]MCP8852476.1 citrate lyase holo-[acyl-carrier protein] synthase [Latilactobacillus sakei]PKX63406.1 citrate lyase holo-[acyl-carrier protein] synthase [Latilactobacillus sakei]PKX68030.1 citrate lyase holo-[acyl-carrier
MLNLFATGIPQEITAVLNNRDQRVELQNQLVADASQTQSVVALKLNIPGPIKNNADLTRLFLAGLAAFKQKLVVVRQIDWSKSTGPETFLIVEGSPLAIKKQAAIFEDRHALGRLFDIDVLIWQSDLQQVQPISRQALGQPTRRCLLCEQPAKVCARSRRHTVAELQAAINQQYQLFMETD